MFLFPGVNKKRKKALRFRPHAECVSVQSLPYNLSIFVLSVVVAQRPSVCDSMLTTPQRVPEKRPGLAVRFSISQRSTRSRTQLMNNNYLGTFPVNASRDFIRGKEGAACCGVPLQTKTSPGLYNWLAAVISVNVSLLICGKCVLRCVDRHHPLPTTHPKQCACFVCECGGSSSALPQLVTVFTLPLHELWQNYS